MKKMNRKEQNQWIGTQIYKKRVKRKWSQEKFSEIVGVSRTFISNLENGNHAAKIDTYCRITYKFNISLGELFRDDENNAEADDILFMLSDCSKEEINAFVKKSKVLLLMKSRKTMFVKF